MSRSVRWIASTKAHTMLYIHPDECIDCGACEPVCPVKAIFAEDETPDQLEELHRDEQAVLQRQSRGQAGDQGLAAHAPRQRARPVVHSPECRGPELLQTCVLREWHVRCGCYGHDLDARTDSGTRRRPRRITAPSSTSSGGSSKRRSTRCAATGPTRRARSGCSGRTSCGSMRDLGVAAPPPPLAGGARQRQPLTLDRPARHLLGPSMLDVWVAGADMTRIGRHGEPLPDLMASAAHAALRGADRERPDAIVVATMNPEEFLGDGNFASNVATHMGFANVPVAPRRDGQLLRRGGVLRRLRPDRRRAGPHGRRRGRREDDAPADAESVGADRALDRSLRALVRDDHARPRRARHPRADEPSRHR